MSKLDPSKLCSPSAFSRRKRIKVSSVYFQPKFSGKLKKRIIPSFFNWKPQGLKVYSLERRQIGTALEWVNYLMCCTWDSSLKFGELLISKFIQKILEIWLNPKFVDISGLFWNKFALEIARRDVKSQKNVLDRNEQRLGVALSLLSEVNTWQGVSSKWSFGILLPDYAKTRIEGLLFGILEPAWIGALLSLWI